MDLENLACFVEVALQRSFTKAAERLYLSQSTVSRRVSRLENELGRQLVLRDTPGFELTSAGTTVLELGTHILAEESALKARLQSQDDNCSGAITIGFYGLFEFLDVAEALRQRMDAAYPRIVVSIYRELLKELQSDFEQRRADMLVAPYCELPSGDGVERCSIIERRLVAYMSHGHPLAQRPSLAPSDFKDVPIVFWKEPTCPGFYRAFVLACRCQGFSPRIVEQHSHEDGIMLSVQENRGITVLFDQAGIQAAHGLARIPVTDMGFSVDLGLAYHTDSDNKVIPIAVNMLKSLRTLPSSCGATRG